MFSDGSDRSDWSEVLSCIFRSARHWLITESEQGAGGSKKRKRGVFFSQKEGRQAGKPL